MVCRCRCDGVRLGIFQTRQPGAFLIVMRILQIANYSEAGGGISVQVKMLQDKIIGEGLVCDVISTKGSLFKRAKSILRLISVGRKYDVFHVHACSGTGFFPAVVGITIGRLFRKRVVLTYHGGGAEAFFEKRYRFIKYFLSHTNANIVLSGFIGNVFERYQIPYTVIPNIVDLGSEHYRKRKVIAPTFISTRALEETYNVGLTIRAFQIVHQKYPEARLTVVGDGSQREHLEAYVKEHNISGVFFTGHVKNDSIYDYLGRSDIFVSSSKVDNMPVSVLEAINAGLLIIASRVGGVPFIIEDKEDGLLFTPDNEQDLADKMIWAIENQTDSIRMIQRASKEIKQYSWESVKNKLFPIYRYE